MDKSRQVYVCQQCGRESLKWLGRCPGCLAWNSFLEKTVAATPAPRPRSAASILPQELSGVTTAATERLVLPNEEFNRVLGGGIVPGSLVLLGGEPGIGKSTLLLQLAGSVAKDQGCVVYVSGEETQQQIKLRAQRLGISGERLFLLAETDLNAVLEQLESLSPALAIVDSIQTMYLPALEAPPGSINQVRECTLRLMRWAKESGVPVFITGHVTKDGSIAGPRVLEHIVDAVLYFEGERFSAYRLVRGVKNRFGSTDEVAIFEMTPGGLAEVANPSQVFLSQRQASGSGTAVVATLEGSRPLLVEVQALTNTTSFGTPRRTANGLDFGRLLMITAVLGRHAGLRLASQDIIVNATGGIRIDEPAADLAIALAIASSYRSHGVDPELVAIGELGLSGELRTVPHLERRLAEAARLGFQRCLIPSTGKRPASVADIKVIPVATIREAVAAALTGIKEAPADV